jgi:hypothetical protein
VRAGEPDSSLYGAGVGAGGGGERRSGTPGEESQYRVVDVVAVVWQAILASDAVSRKQRKSSISSPVVVLLMPRCSAYERINNNVIVVIIASSGQ